jgi:carbamoyl-phosphate synthase large subunit
MKETNILFTCAGRRNYLINYFKEALKGNGKIIAVDGQTNAPALIDADLAIQVPNIYSDLYIQSLKDICIEHKVHAIISLNDLELPILSKHKAELEECNTKVIVSNEFVIDVSFDKWKTFEFLKSIGLSTPNTYLSIDKVKEDIVLKSLKFPLVLKPRWGSASIGIEFVENEEELEYAYKLLKSKLSRSILDLVSKSDINNAILIQESINGVEYGIDILNDFNGNYYGTFSREKLSMRSGETDKAMSVINPNLSEIGECISKKLRHLGNMDCDVFINSEKIYVLELNPRFGGGYPFSHEAGINTAAIYIDWINGKTQIDHHNNYQENIAFAKFDQLMRIPN